MIMLVITNTQERTKKKKKHEDYIQEHDKIPWSSTALSYEADLNASCVMIQPVQPAFTAELPGSSKLFLVS